MKLLQLIIFTTIYANLTTLCKAICSWYLQEKALQHLGGQSQENDGRVLVSVEHQKKHLLYMKHPPPIYGNEKKKNILVELDWLSESRLFQSNFISNFRSLNVGYQYKTSIYMKLYLNTAIFKCINLHIKNAERVHFQPLELICHDNQGVTYNQNANAIF